MSTSSGWMRKRVRDLIVHHASGPSPTCEERNIRDDEEWGLLKTTAVTWRGWNPAAHKVPPRQFWGNRAIEVRSGDVLITKAGPRDRCGVTVYVPETPPRLMVSGKMVLLRPNSDKTNAAFLASALATPAAQRFLDARTTGLADAQLNFTNQLLLDIEIDLPQPEIQDRIAAIRMTVDEAIEQTEALIAKTQQIKAGLMHDLFTRGVTADGQLRPPREEAPQLYKESPLGWIPKEWEVDVFGDRISIIDPNPSHRYPEEQEVGVPICSTENFRGDDGFDLSRSKLMPPHVLVEQQQRCRFSSNDVVFARKGRIGLARRYGDEPKVFSHTVVLFKTSDATVDQNWLLWLSRSRWFLDDIDRRMNSNSGVPTLGVAFINAVTVPFPPANEQQVINLHLDEISARESTEGAYLRKLRRLKAGLMHDLLTGRVHVPAAELKEVAI